MFSQVAFSGNAEGAFSREMDMVLKPVTWADIGKSAKSNREVS